VQSTRRSHRTPRAVHDEQARIAVFYSLKAAIAVSPLFTVTLFDLVAPFEGLQITE